MEKSYREARITISLSSQQQQDLQAAAIFYDISQASIIRQALNKWFVVNRTDFGTPSVKEQIEHTKKPGQTVFTHPDNPTISIDKTWNDLNDAPLITEYVTKDMSPEECQQMMELYESLIEPGTI